MKEEVITYITAVSAKDKGFNHRGSLMYDRHGEIQPVPSIKRIVHEGGGIKELKRPSQLFAPTQSFLQKWLRETYEVEIDICTGYRGYAFEVMSRNHEEKWLEMEAYSDERFETYELALEAGLFEAIKVIQ